ncbi:MAG: recombinase family protein [Bacteroidetes bacterium]|nr:recombinase family protein [Bacteroidota bacterium]
MVYGYARCSTNESKQDIERQKRELKALGAQELYFEYESGTKLERPELAKLLKYIKTGDTLVTTEISRITRSMKQLCDFIDLAVERKLKLIIGNFKMDCTKEIDPMTEGMIKMMGVFSEMERNLTSERVRSGIRNARAKGIRLGRPRLVADDVPKKILEYFEMYRAGQINKAEFARLSSISKPTAYKYIALLTDS